MYIVTPSQRRYVGYFSQRFAAMPGSVRISRVVIPNTHLKMSKLRLEVSYLKQGSAGVAMVAIRVAIGGCV